MSTADKIYREAQRLPEPLAQEVLDFIGFLEQKHGRERAQHDELKQAQQPAMERIWNNPDDEVWNDL